MIMKRRIMAIVAVTCAMVLTNTFAAEMAASSGAVVPGEWNSHFYAGKAYAEANNVPMLLFWANPGCGNCEKMISAVKTTEFKSWMASSGYVFVFVEGATTKEKSDAKDFAWNVSKKFPYMSVYFPTSEGWARYKEKTEDLTLNSAPSSLSSLERPVEREPSLVNGSTLERSVFLLMTITGGVRGAPRCRSARRSPVHPFRPSRLRLSFSAERRSSSPARLRHRRDRFRSQSLATRSR